MEGEKIESLAQRLFAALNKNRGAYLNDYEVARISGLHESDLDQAKMELDEVLIDSDTHISTVNKNDRKWKMTSKRPEIKTVEDSRISLF